MPLLGCSHRIAAGRFNQEVVRSPPMRCRSNRRARLLRALRVPAHRFTRPGAWRVVWASYRRRGPCRAGVEAHGPHACAGVHRSNRVQLKRFHRVCCACHTKFSGGRATGNRDVIGRGFSATRAGISAISACQGSGRHDVGGCTLPCACMVGRVSMAVRQLREVIEIERSGSAASGPGVPYGDKVTSVSLLLFLAPLFSFSNRMI